MVGSGIGGMESALKLGDMGYKVLVVEKDASVGGKMILLSKVFPTLDCASCISTPKMAATIHHPNIDVLTYAQVEGIRDNGDGTYHAKITQKPKFIDEAACTGCRQCEMACNVAVPDEFNADMVSRRAAYIAFPQAVPKKAVIDRAGVSPCTYECPAGIKAHGYVARVRSGEYEEAFGLVLETTPLVGSLGRACYAPCEEQCTRGELEGPLPIRRLKRFIADQHYGQAELKPLEKPEQNGKKVAVVGSGPAGLTAAWQLARKGYGVKIFDSAPQAGGMLRLGIPAYRLPNDVIDDDIANVTAIGVEIATGTRVDDVAGLKNDGFDAVLVATGTHKSVSLRVPGEDLAGVQTALEFLARRQARMRPSTWPASACWSSAAATSPSTRRAPRAVSAPRPSIRSASSPAKRCPPTTSRSKRPAPRASRCTTAGASTTSRATASSSAPRSRSAPACSTPTAASTPNTTRASADVLACDVVIIAAGMGADTEAFGLETNGNRTLKADPATLQTAVPHVFAAGDVVTGPTMINSAVGHGRRAAFMIDRYLQGAEMDPSAFDEALGVVDKNDGAPPAGRLRPARAARVQRRHERLADRLHRDRDHDDRGRSVPRRRPLSRLRRLLRVPRLRGRLPCRRDQARRCAARRSRPRSAASSSPPASSSSRPTPSRSTATAATRTSSPACRWTACWRRPGRTTP